jgi:hypothetical protein
MAMSPGIELFFLWPEADMPVRLDTVHCWQSGGEHSEIHFCTSSEPGLEIITCKSVYFSASATAGARLAGLSNTITLETKTRRLGCASDRYLWGAR